MSQNNYIISISKIFKVALSFNVMVMLLLVVGVTSSFADWSDDFTGGETDPPDGFWNGFSVTLSLANPTGDPVVDINAPFNVVNDRIEITNVTNASFEYLATFGAFVDDNIASRPHRYQDVRVAGLLGADPTVLLVNPAVSFPNNDNAYGLIARASGFDSYVLHVDNESQMLRLTKSEAASPAPITTILASASIDIDPSYYFELDVVNVGAEAHLSGRVYDSQGGALIQQLIGVDDSANVFEANYAGFAAQVDLAGLLGDQEVGSLNVHGDDLSATTLVSGDANFDDSVDQADFRELLSGYGKNTNGTWDEGDFDLDGKVTLNDLLLMRNAFVDALPTEAPVATSTVVPEPSTVVMLLTGMIGLIGYLRSRRKLAC